MEANAQQIVQTQYGVGISDDRTKVIIALSIPVSQILLDPKEARRLAGMLRKMANGCVVVPVTAPPRRDTRYMEVDNATGSS